MRGMNIKVTIMKFRVSLNMGYWTYYLIQHDFTPWITSLDV